MEPSMDNIDWATVGGFRIVDSHTIVEFLDPNGRHVHVHKRQKVVPMLEDASFILEMDVRSDGEVREFKCSPGSISLVRRAGVGYQVGVKFEPPLPKGQTTERIFEYDLWDAFLDPKRETYMLHVKRPSQRFTIEFRFHIKHLPASVQVLDTTYGMPRDLGAIIKPQDSDSSVWRCDVEAPALGSSYMFEWNW